MADNSDKKTNIYEALNNAQKAFPELKKDGYNKFQKNKYVKLESMLKAIAKPLNDNGLMLMQPVENGNLVTRIMKVDTGETIESVIPICFASNPETGMVNPQYVGAQISYFRRYSLGTMIGVITEDDEDGAGAGKESGKKSTSEKPISGAQVGRLHTMRKGKIPEGKYREILSGLGYESTKDIKQCDYEEISTLVEAAIKASEKQLEKFGGRMNRKQGEAILAIGESIGLTQKGVHDIIDWFCANNEFGGRSFDAGKYLLSHFDEIHDKYKESKEN